MFLMSIFIVVFYNLRAAVFNTFSTHECIYNSM